VLIAPRFGRECAQGKRARLTPAAIRGDSVGMDLEELFPSKPDDPLVLLTRQDLDPLSIEELHARIATLEGEIARVRAKIEASVNHRASAEALFKK
jgi:uncharacterized small protein (DUF1192 family)